MMNIRFFKAIVRSIAFFFAINAPQILAVEKDNSPSKCGSFSPMMITRMNAIADGKALDNTRPTIQNELTHSSPSGKFLIHYTNQGKDSVSQIDTDKNGVPDWVDSTGIYMDFAYKAEVNEMGFAPPPTDDTAGGSPQYDIYIEDLSDYNNVGVYGITFPTLPISGGVFPRSISYIKIDNNFSSNDKIGTSQVFNTFGYEALKVTTAHEFHHAIQYGGYGIAPQSSSFYEMMSTWIELHLYPEITDYTFYLQKFFNNNKANCFGQSDASLGYSYCHVLEYFHTLYGGEGIKRIWELIGVGVLPYRAMDSMLVENKSNLSSAWCNFLPWMYYTGKRAIPGQYFSKAAMYPEVPFIREETFTPPSFMATQQIKPYEIQFFRCFLPAELAKTTPVTADFLITFPNLSDILNQTQRPGEYTIICTRESQPRPIVGTRYSWDLKTTNPELCNQLIALNTSSNDGVYPNPFHIETDDEINFPIPTDADLTDKAMLSIYTVDWMNDYSGQEQITLDDSRRVVVSWKPNKELLASNAYIYVLDIKGKLTIGKFSVVR